MIILYLSMLLFWFHLAFCSRWSPNCFSGPGPTFILISWFWVPSMDSQSQTACLRALISPRWLFLSILESGQVANFLAASQCQQVNPSHSHASHPPDALWSSVFCTEECSPSPAWLRLWQHLLCNQRPGVVWGLLCFPQSLWLFS